jgi:hypothetical protein
LKPESEQFSARLGPATCPPEFYGMAPLWIPFFVKARVGDLWRYQDICNGLKVELHSQDEDYQTFQARYRALVARYRDAPEAFSAEGDANILFSAGTGRDIDFVPGIGDTEDL